MHKTSIELEIRLIKSELQALGSEKNRLGMARFGIETSTAYGTGMAPVREMAKRYRKQHELALALWKENIHELRILAAWIDDPTQVTEKQMDAWVKELNSWDLCDQVCSKLFCRTPFAEQKVWEWSSRDKEFEKRAAFVLIASMAVHLKKAPDSLFLSFFPLLEKASDDHRNFVWKAVNWALRQIGKRNKTLLEPAWILAQEFAQSESKAARKIGKDACREFLLREGKGIQTALNRE
jgi:3-methyladenine DNA glycosylase AlkD